MRSTIEEYPYVLGKDNCTEHKDYFEHMSWIMMWFLWNSTWSNSKANEWGSHMFSNKGNSQQQNNWKRIPVFTSICSGGHDFMIFVTCRCSWKTTEFLTQTVSWPQGWQHAGQNNQIWVPIQISVRFNRGRLKLIP